MALRGILYKKLKQKINENKAKQPRKENAKEPVRLKRAEQPAVAAKPAVAKPVPAAEIKGSARYWGGHFLYPIKIVEIGELSVNKNAIIFTKYGFLKRTEWCMEIPLNRIEWQKVANTTEEDGLYNITCFTIPFKDDKGIRHQPKFSVENSRARESFSRFLYKKMSRKS